MSVTQETRDGEIKALYGEDFGELHDTTDNESHNFDQKGANIMFVVGDAITYLRIGLPNGKVIVKQVKKKN